MPQKIPARPRLRWSDLPEIAQEIYDKFKAYVAYHPKITLSGGIYLAPSPKFPVYQAAKEAGDAEEKAKTGEKNRLSFFDITITWEELKELAQIKDEILKLVAPQEEEKRKMPRALFTLLYAGIQDDEKTEIPRIWLFLYGLRRMVDRYISDDKEQIRLSNELRKIFTTNFRMKKNLALSVRWADYLTRKGTGGER